MAQITITIPENLDRVIRLLADDQDRSMSQISATCLEIGLYSFIESQNKVEVYRSLVQKRIKAQQAESDPSARSE
jgi:hypothetical protein